MDYLGFYTGKIVDAYEFLGAHLEKDGTMFRVFAPAATKCSIIGEFSNWEEIPMSDIQNNQFYEVKVPKAKEGMAYQIRIYKQNGQFVDHCDPYGYGMELRPKHASIIRDLEKYVFQDDGWMNAKKSFDDKPINIYEMHMGSWRKKGDGQTDWHRYEEMADLLIPYMKDCGYNYIEVMPLCEYPSDESWGYQAVGFFSPTSRYGTADGLKAFIDKCHQNGIGVLLDFAPVHFAVDDWGLSNFDGTPLYEYPHQAVGYNEWGSKNFMHSRGEVRSYLQSAAMYWIKEYHFDGIRMDAISNMIYWQGDQRRGVNNDAVNFLKSLNKEIKEQFPNVIMVAEDSTAFPKVTHPINQGGLGFDYKWDMGWMNDTLEYFRTDPQYRAKDYYKLAFSMDYFFNEKYLLPLSHDEVVHGKATILQKMAGDYDVKFPQGRAFYLYMYAHPGKKLNFMGSELGQFREWDEKRQQDWMLLDNPNHKAFHHFMTTLNHVYLEQPALSERDYEQAGFEWVEAKATDKCVYAFLRTSTRQTILAVFNFSDKAWEGFKMNVRIGSKASLLLDSNWEEFGGSVPRKEMELLIQNQSITMDLEAFSGKLFILEQR